MKLHWDRIKSIEFITDYNEPFVYDFSVADNETFTATNGIILHNTLDTFHSCGVPHLVNMGVPRIRELISASKKIKTPSMRVFLRKNDKDHAKNILHALQSVCIDYFIKDTFIYYDPVPRQTIVNEDHLFVQQYYQVQDKICPVDMNTISPWMLRLVIYPLHLINKSITMFDILRFLIDYFEKKKIKSHIIYSDENAAHSVFIIRIIHKDITVYDTKKDCYCTSEDYYVLNNVERELTYNYLFRGVKNIDGGVIDDQRTLNGSNEVFIDTMGSNLFDLLQFRNDINIQKTFSNNIHEINELLGIEACREILKREIHKTLSSSGVTVLDQHIDLLTDAMTLNGGLISMNRYGIGKSDNGVFSMASFEEPDFHFVQGAVYQKSDPMDSIASNVLMGQYGKFGTGIVELLMDLEK